MKNGCYFVLNTKGVPSIILSEDKEADWDFVRSIINENTRFLEISLMNPGLHFIYHPMFKNSLTDEEEEILNVLNTIKKKKGTYVFVDEEGIINHLPPIDKIILMGGFEPSLIFGNLVMYCNRNHFTKEQLTKWTDNSLDEKIDLDDYFVSSSGSSSSPPQQKEKKPRKPKSINKTEKMGLNNNPEPTEFDM